MIDDPLHEWSPPDVRWTTNNFAEALPSVPTPLTWTLWKHAITYACFDTFRRLGVFSSHDLVELTAAGARPVAAFHGHVAGNIDLFSRATAALPGMDPGAFEHQLFGLDPSLSPYRPTRQRWPAIALRAPGTLAGLRRRLDRGVARTTAWWSERTRRPLGEDDARAALAEANREFAAVLSAHTLTSQVAQGAFDRLAKVVADAGAPGLEARLVSGCGGVEEAELAEDLWTVAHGWRPLDAFLARHGFHGPDEGELANRVWREAPALLEGVLAAFAREDDDRSPAALAARQRAERIVAEDELRERVGSLRWRAVRVLVRAAQRLVPRRELGKAGFLRCIDVARHAARGLGAALADRGVLASADDVCFLTLDECVRCLPPAPRDVVEARREAHEQHRGVTLPAVWRGMPEPRAASTEAVVADGPVRGTAVTPGRVEARARVVLDPADCTEPVGADEVLVTRTTDPSWVAFFLTAAGLVVDVGGPMSHGAIIARELGIPCVIGTGDGTARIPDGARIVLDGTAGEVEVVGAG